MASRPAPATARPGLAWRSGRPDALLYTAGPVELESAPPSSEGADEARLPSPAANGDTTSSELTDLYGEFYYRTYAGLDYDRSEPHWTRFFGMLADHIVRDINPRTVLDAGCAKGFLVEALRDRGVEAYGVDASEYAISSVREDIRPYCRVGSVTDELDRDYDLITCFEVLEHLPLAESVDALANLCRHTGDLIFSSTPTNAGEATHINVHPPEWWAERFAQQGFYRDVDYDAGYVIAWAVRMRRSTDTAPRIIGNLERLTMRLLGEVRDRQETLLKQERVLGEQTERIARLEEELRRANQAVDQELGPLRAQVDALVLALSQSETLVVEAERRRAEDLRAAEDLARIESSAAYRAAVSFRHRLHRAMPPDTRRGRAALTGAHGLVLLGEQGPAAVARRLRERIRTRSWGGRRLTAEDVHAALSFDEAGQAEYERWLAVSAPTGSDLARMRDLSRRLPIRPLVSVVVPVYNSEETWLRQTIESVREQAYENWELCLADDCSPDPRVRTVLEEAAASDPRIRLAFRERNGGIAQASNSAIELATGDWIAFLDHDDLLQPHALYRMVERINTEPGIDLVYSDEDKLLPDGRRGVPFFKPDWSPDLLLSINYVCHFTMVRASVLHDLGGFREGFDGSQDHELFLRIADREGAHVAHVPDVLYTWRMLPGSSALDPDAKPRAATARRAAIEQTLERRGITGIVERAAHPGWYHIRYAIRGTPSVTVIIPTRDRVDLLRRCIESIRNVSTYANLRVAVVDNDSRDPATLEYLLSPDLTVIRHPGNFNYAAILNHAVRDLAPLDDEHLLFLNNDMEAWVPDWIEAMLEQSQRPEVGAVGCRLVYPDGRPQHEGVAIGIGGTANNLDLSCYFGLGQVIRDVGAVTGAAMMMRRDTFAEVSGFDEGLRVAFNDIDLCMRLRQRGYRVVYTPLAQLVHYESASRGRMHPIEDEAHFAERWGSGEALRDPYVNPNIAWYAPLRLNPLHPSGRSAS